MRPRVRRLALTAHVGVSVGWLGAVASFLALSIVGLAAQDEQTMRAAYLAMESTGWFVLVPLALASLLTGLLQATGTRWGLFRHYWVVLKLAINVFATVVLVMYTQTLASLADSAADTSADLELARRLSPVLHAAAALLLLLAATTLGVLKPRGLTPYGRRKQVEQRAGSRPVNVP
jgi:hypothetical protein